MVAAVASPDHERAKASDMVPDFEKITIDEEDIYEETEDMINHCVIPSCPKTHDAADLELEEATIDDSTISLGRRAVHPLKSSLTRSSGCTSAASTEEASSMMDESSTSTMMLDESHSLIRGRSVCFTQLEIRSYGVTLGDAPTFNGCPITLGWDYDPAETETYDVDVYEHNRCGRRAKIELLIPPSHRESLLIQSGFSRSQIKCAIKEAKQAAKDREKTAQNFKRSRRLSFEEMWCRATGAIRRR